MPRVQTELIAETKVLTTFEDTVKQAENGAEANPQEQEQDAEQVEEPENPDPDNQKLPLLSNKQALVLLKSWWLDENQYKLTVP